MDFLERRETVTEDNEPCRCSSRAIKTTIRTKRRIEKKDNKKMWENRKDRDLYFCLYGAVLCEHFAVILSTNTKKTI